MLSGRASVPLALSPDGMHLAYVAKRAGSTQLFLRALDRFESRALPGTEGAITPFFSPDGQWVGFFTEDRRLQKVSVAGGSPVTICDVSRGGTDSGASWALDDNIVFSMMWDLWRVSAGGGSPEKLGPGRWPQILPDGRSVLATVKADEARLDLRPAVVSLETGESRMLDRGRAGARYLPSGHLVYGESGSLMAVRFDVSRLQLQGSPEPVVDHIAMHPYGVASFSVSDDGTLGYVTTEHDEEALEWVDREGRATPFLKEKGDLLWPDVSPDGTRVAAIRLTDRNDFDIWPRWTPQIRPLIDTSKPAISGRPRQLMFTAWPPARKSVLSSCASSGVRT